jgi:hypothetical protein
VKALRRALYVQAVVWVVAGIGLALVPSLVTRTLFHGPPHQETMWVRLLGVQAVGLALVMVLVAQRIEQMWWWSWAFALVALGTTAGALLNAAFGLGPHQSAAWWWAFGVTGVAICALLLYGLASAAREQPFPG